MKLRDIDFGTVLGASGVQGFFGEGYAYHRLLGPLGPNFDGMTFVSKTTTVEQKDGNMPLTSSHEPRELTPKCIWVNPLNKIALNAVGLSGPGLNTLLATSKWQSRTEPFLISYMPVGTNRQERVKETAKFVKTIGLHMRMFKSKFGVQFNLTCPNVGANIEELIEEAGEHLDLLGTLSVPVMVKINLTVTPLAAFKISQHPACDGLCNTNTIPFGKWDKIDWKKHFPKGSPLATFGGGGLSGELLFNHLAWWVTALIPGLGYEKSLNAGGGIMRKMDIDILVASGLRPAIDSVFLGTVAMVRPWRVRGIIKHAHKVLAAEPA